MRTTGSEADGDGAAELSLSERKILRTVEAGIGRNLREDVDCIGGLVDRLAARTIGHDGDLLGVLDQEARRLMESAGSSPRGSTTTPQTRGKDQLELLLRSRQGARGGWETTLAGVERRLTELEAVHAQIPHLAEEMVVIRARLHGVDSRLDALSTPSSRDTGIDDQDMSVEVTDFPRGAVAKSEGGSEDVCTRRGVERLIKEVMREQLSGEQRASDALLERVTKADCRIAHEKFASTEKRLEDACKEVAGLKDWTAKASSDVSKLVQLVESLRSEVRCVARDATGDRELKSHLKSPLAQDRELASQLQRQLAQVVQTHTLGATSQNGEVDLMRSSVEQKVSDVVSGYVERQSAAMLDKMLGKMEESSSNIQELAADVSREHANRCEAFLAVDLRIDELSERLNSAKLGPSAADTAAVAVLSRRIDEVYAALAAKVEEVQACGEEVYAALTAKVEQVQACGEQASAAIAAQAEVTALRLTQDFRDVEKRLSQLAQPDDLGAGGADASGSG